MTNLLLAFIVALLLWDRVVPVLRRQWRARPSSVAAPSVLSAHPHARDDSLTLHLCGPDGVEHEVTLSHRGELPTLYAYAGKRYERRVRRPDGSWEYRR